MALFVETMESPSNPVQDSSVDPAHSIHQSYVSIHEICDGICIFEAIVFNTNY